MECNLCGSSTLIAGTFLIYTSFRCEDKDYISIRERYSRKKKGYLEIVRYCPSCLRKFCLGSHSS